MKLQTIHDRPVLLVGCGALGGSLAQTLVRCGVGRLVLADRDVVIEAKGLKQMNDDAALQAIVDAVVAANQKSVAEYRAGKDKAFNALVGQVMKGSQGKANPAQAAELLRQRLQGDA